MIKAARWTIYWINMDEEKVVPQVDALVNLEETFHRREAI